MGWSGITSVVTYSAGNAQAITDQPGEMVRIRTIRPATGPDGSVVIYDQTGAPVHTITVTGSNPDQTVAFAASATSLNYSTTVAFDSPGLQISWQASEATPSYDPATNTTQFGGAVRANRFARPIQVSNGVNLTPDHTLNVAGGWGYAPAANLVVSVTSENQRVPGRNVIKIDASAKTGDVYVTLRRKAAVGSVTGSLSVWLWSPAVQGEIDHVIGYSSDVPAADPPTATPTNRVTYSGYGIRRASWMRFNVAVGTTSGNFNMTRTATASPVITQINQFYIQCYFPTALAAEKRIVYVDTVTIGEMQKPKIFLTSDGDPSLMIEKVTPLLRARGLPMGILFGDRNNAISNADRLIYHRAIDQGWEVGCNGQQHHNYTVYPELLDSECAAAEQFYVDAGIPKPTLFGCPVGANDGTVNAILKNRGYVGVRGTGLGAWPYTTDGFQSATGISIEAGMTPATFLAYLDAAIAAGGHTAILLHTVIDTVTSAPTQISTADFTTILDGIVSRRNAGILEPTTMGDFCRIAA